MDVPDTDLEADVYEILPGGDSVYLTGATMRARYRESLRQEKLVTPGKDRKNTCSITSHFFQGASRREAVCGCSCIARTATGTEKNYNSGGVVALETAKDAKTAHVTLVHDAEHQSTLELPVVN